MSHPSAHNTSLPVERLTGGGLYHCCLISSLDKRGEVRALLVLHHQDIRALLARGGIVARLDELRDKSGQTLVAQPAQFLFHAGASGRRQGNRLGAAPGLCRRGYERDAPPAGMPLIATLCVCTILLFSLRSCYACARMPALLFSIPPVGEMTMRNLRRVHLIVVSCGAPMVERATGAVG